MSNKTQEELRAQGEQQIRDNFDVVEALYFIQKLFVNLSIIETSDPATDKALRDICHDITKYAGISGYVNRKDGTQVLYD